MKVKLLLIVILTILIIPGCSNDEHAPPVAAPDPVSTPPYAPDKPEITPTNPPSESQTATPPPPDTQTATQTAPPTTLTPHRTEPNIPPVANTIGMPDYSKHPYNPQEDIAGAVNIFSFSRANFNKEKYLSVLHGDDLTIKFYAADLDCLAAFKNYENAYVAAYGLDEWKKFSPYSSTIDSETLLKNLALMEITQSGDQAVCRLPGSGQPPVHTIRIDKLWYINLNLMLPYDPAQTKSLIDAFNKRIQLLHEMLPLIGNPEYSPQKINDQFNNRLNEIIKSP